MNFYNDDEKKGGAAVPGAFKKTSAFGKAPLFSRTAGGLMDRLKNLSRKDMAFVGIGLSVLVMAPVAEYMMSKPSSDNLLTPGFGDRGSSLPGGGLYEPGINALSQGSPDGSGEVITPLSSRDPVSLILGSQPATPAAPPPMAPPTTFRDSMKDVGRAAFSEAAKAAPSPTPIPKMQAALRSFGSFFGGGDSTRTSGGLGGGKIIDDAKSASSKAAKRSMVGPVAMPGYKGVASNTPNSSSKGAFEKLRSAADKAAGNFSGGSAMNSLDKAAADSLNIGSGGGGLGHGGDSEKTTKPSNSTTKYDHSRSGESLAEMAAKQRMQKALEWEFYKKYEIPKKIIEAILTGITGPLTEMVSGSMKSILGLNPPPPSKCWVPMGRITGTLSADWIAARQACAGSSNPACVVERVCTIDGGPTQISYQAGKESASSYEKNCLCNDYAGKPAANPNPATGAGPGAGPTPPATQDPPSTPPQGGQPGAGAGASHEGATAQNPALSDYDAALKNIVERTLQAAAETRTAEANLAAVLDSFKTLETQVTGPIQRYLSESHAKTASTVSEFKSAVARGRSDKARIEPEYVKFSAAIDKIKADIQAGALREARQAPESRSSSDPAPVAAKLPPEAVARVQAAVREWEEKGKASYEMAAGLLVLNERWVPWYEAQSASAAQAPQAIVAKQGEVSAAVARINGSGGITEKFKALTGKDVEAPAQAETPPAAPDAQGRTRSETPAAGVPSAGGTPQLSVETGMRGAAVEPLWKGTISTKDSEKAESDEWARIYGEAPKAVQAQVPANMVAAPLRMKSIIDSIVSERSPTVQTMLTNFAEAEAGMKAAKEAILKEKLDPAYFNGVILPVQPPATTPPQVPAQPPVVTPPAPTQPPAPAPKPKPKPTVDQHKLDSYRDEIRTRNQDIRTRSAALTTAQAGLSTANANYANRTNLCRHFTAAHQGECVSRLQAEVSAATRQRDAAKVNYDSAMGACVSYYNGLPANYKKFITTRCGQ